MSLKDIASLKSIIASDNVEEKIKLRAEIIYQYLIGNKSIAEIAESLLTSRPTAYRWIERYKKRGLNGILRDLPRIGRPKNRVRNNGILSPRELEIIYLVSIGKTSWEIGIILDLSARTIDGHLDNIKRKLGVSTRAEAIAAAFRKEVLT